MDIATMLAQLGAAGLIGWMWLVERRASAARDRQIAEAHERLMQERVQLDVLMSLVAESSRAIAALEGGQRRLGEVLERLAERMCPPPRPGRHDEDGGRAA